MNRIQRAIIGKDTTASTGKNFLWNMFGSGIYSLISMLLSVFAIQIVGESEGGIFSAAITISQMLMYIAYFEIRTYQVTDTSKKYTFAQYHGAKVITCTLMILVSAVYILLQDYSVHKAVIVFLMCIYRLLDGYADLYEGQFQLDNRIYLSGKSMLFRSVISSVFMLGVMAVTKNVEASLLAGIVSGAAVLFVCDAVVAQNFVKIKPAFDFKTIRNILADCFPFFVGTFCWVFILSASRLAVDRNMDSQFMAYYQMLFLPVSVINLFATFLFRPMLTPMAELYSTGNQKEFNKKVFFLLAMISGLTIICMIVAFACGIPVLSWISGCDLGFYRNELVLLMLAGGFNSASYFLYYILTITRNSGGIIFGYGTAAVLAAVCSEVFVRTWAIDGAVFSFLAAVVYLTGVFVLIYFHGCRKRKDRNEKRKERMLKSSDKKRNI